MCVCIYIYIHTHTHTHTYIHTYICIRKPLPKDSYEFIASVVQESDMSAEDPQKDTDENFEVLAEQNLSLCDFFHQKSNGLT